RRVARRSRAGRNGMGFPALGGSDGVRWTVPDRVSYSLTGPGKGGMAPGGVPPQRPAELTMPALADGPGRNVMVSPFLRGTTGSLAVLPVSRLLQPRRFVR